MQPICMHTHTRLKTLTQKHRNVENRAKLKTINLTTEHALKQKARKPKLKQTCYITNKPRDKETTRIIIRKERKKILRTYTSNTKLLGLILIDPLSQIYSQSNKID